MPAGSPTAGIATYLWGACVRGGFSWRGVCGAASDSVPLLRESHMLRGIPGRPRYACALACSCEVDCS